MRLLVYAIIAGVRVPPLSGGRDTRLRVVNVGRIAAVVDRRRHVPAPTPRNIRQFHRTVAAIADAVPAIVPARFGTLVREEELSLILDARAVSLGAALKRLRGRVQMTIRIANRRDELQPGADVTRGAAFPARLGQAVLDADGAAATKDLDGRDGPGARYLRSRIPREDRVTQRLLAPLRRSVHQWVHEEQVTAHSGVTSVYHLVARRSTAAYARALQAAAHEAGLYIVLSGPFPPFAFASML